jgi:hypothetical protein
MKQNRDLLSEACRTAIDEIKAWRKTHPSNPAPAKPSAGGSSASYWERLQTVLS